MPVFDYSFDVDAPVEVVSRFHFQPGVLKKLSPPLPPMQVHRFEPLAEGAVAEFTLWMGPVPVYWKALHADVSETGFTDTQIAGPMKHWKHTHSFEPLGDSQTRVSEHIEYEHHGGLRGLWSRLLFLWPALRLLFGWRAMVTRREAAKMLQQSAGPAGTSGNTDATA